MPLYEYVCTDCDNRFELIRPISRAAESAPCPTCQHESERALSRFACFTTGDGGVPVAVGGGDGCSSCSSSNCSTCGV